MKPHGGGPGGERHEEDHEEAQLVHGEGQGEVLHGPHDAGADAAHTGQERGEEEGEEEDVFGWGHFGMDESGDDLAEGGTMPKLSSEAKRQDSGAENDGSKSCGVANSVEGNLKPPETARQRLERLRSCVKAKEEKAKAEKEEKKKKNEEEAKKHEEGQGVHISQIAIGSITIDPSHRLYHKRGIIWCWECGVVASQTPRDLGQGCALKVTRGRKYWLNRLRAGETPRKGMQWPFEMGSGPPEGRVRL